MSKIFPKTRVDDFQLKSNTSMISLKENAAVLDRIREDVEVSELSKNAMKMELKMKYEFKVNRSRSYNNHQRIWNMG